MNDYRATMKVAPKVVNHKINELENNAGVVLVVAHHSGINSR